MGKDSNPFIILDGYENYKELKYYEYIMPTLKTEKQRLAWKDFVEKSGRYQELEIRISILKDDVPKQRYSCGVPLNDKEINTKIKVIDELRKEQQELDKFFGWMEDGTWKISPHFVNGHAATHQKGGITTAQMEYVVEQLYDVPPFVHHYMINISPRWNSQHAPTDIEIELFEKCIKEYLSCGVKGGWWAKAHYAMESGGTGEHLHAHLVCKPNQNCLKSVDKYMDGNHSTGFTKIFNKHMGAYGVCKGRYAIQKMVLRNEDLIFDKQQYLREWAKEEGHKNKAHAILNRRVEWNKV